MERGLRLIVDTINAHRRIAAETPPRLSVTKKTGIARGAGPKKREGDPADFAAMRLLGEAIRNRTGRPHLKATAVLAEVVLDCGEINEDRLLHALRARKQDWRLPLWQV
jgi:hypothetical protein